jgi:hypothetical protein
LSVTLQTGQPLFLTLMNPRVADGNQRPNILCSQPGTGISYHQAAATGESIFNLACFGDPGDQQPGNAPRYLSSLRLDGIKNLDLALRKEFVPREGTKPEVRVESFHATNTTRFGNPDTAHGSPTFGQVFNLGPGFIPNARRSWRDSSLKRLKRHDTGLSWVYNGRPNGYCNSSRASRARRTAGQNE